MKYYFNPYSMKDIMKGVRYGGDDDIPTFSLYLNHPDFAIFSASNKGIVGLPGALSSAAGIASMFSFGPKGGGHRKRAPLSSRRRSKPVTVRSQALNSSRRLHRR